MGRKASGLDAADERAMRRLGADSPRWRRRFLTGFCASLKAGATLGGGGEMAGVDEFLDQFLCVMPESDRAVGDVAVAGDDAVVGDAVFFPTAALHAAVEQHRLEAVAGGGEFGLGRFLRLEFVPQPAKLARLVGGQQAEDAVGGDRLALVLVDHRGVVVGERVAGVDFDEIVDDEHFQDVEDVEARPVGVLGEHDDAEAEMPRMLGVVLGAAALGVERLAEDFLQLVALGDEPDLADEAGGGGFGGTFGRRSHETHERHERKTGNAEAGRMAHRAARRGRSSLRKRRRDDTVGAMEIALTKELETFIGEKVRSGRYVDASDVVRDALRELQEREAFDSPELEGALREGVRSPHEPYGADTLERVRAMAKAGR